MEQQTTPVLEREEEEAVSEEAALAEQPSASESEEKENITAVEAVAEPEEEFQPRKRNRFSFWCYRFTKRTFDI
ncbi:MAG: hypothetical protein K2N74_01220, partial [Clostridiales bacterium]|nr:hypothetical protein [Clostridiales bacterium]